MHRLQVCGGGDLQVLPTLLSSLRFTLKSAVHGNGMRKDVCWRIDSLQVLVVRELHGDFETAQVALSAGLSEEHL